MIQVVTFERLYATGVLCRKPGRYLTRPTIIRTHIRLRALGGMAFVGVSACALGESIFVFAMITR